MTDRLFPSNKMWQDIRGRIEAQADNDYRKFMKTLVPGDSLMIGVRLPLLRKLAREIAEEDPETFLRDYTVVTFEDAMLKGMVIGCMKGEIDSILREADAFLPSITNWSVCDSFCSGLKITKRHKESVWCFITKHIRGENTYEVRVALVLILNYFIEEAYIEKIFREIESISQEDVYVKMAEAWLVSFCYVKYPRSTLIFLKNNRTFDRFTYNKAIQKICESRRVSKEEKTMLKSLKK